MVTTLQPLHPLRETEEKVTPDVEKLRGFIAHGAPGPHYYVVLLGLRLFDLPRLLRSVEQGLSYQAFERFQRNTAWSYDDLIEWVQISHRTLTRRRQQGRLSPEESDRLLRASRLFAKAVELFEGNPDAATEWLSTPQPALGGAAPVDVARSELGGREVENLIDRLEHGVYS
jgi:putative toxin-antitoxin system antitoxin component (TIGR02293 family)